jgi:hypothetical protein
MSLWSSSASPAFRPCWRYWLHDNRNLFVAGGHFGLLIALSMPSVTMRLTDAFFPSRTGNDSGVEARGWSGPGRKVGVGRNRVARCSQLVLGD